MKEKQFESKYLKVLKTKEEVKEEIIRAVKAGDRVFDNGKDNEVSKAYWWYAGRLYSALYDK